MRKLLGQVSLTLYIAGIDTYDHGNIPSQSETLTLRSRPIRT